MKVLIVNTSDNKGGAAIAAKRIHSSLIILGVESKMLVLQKSTNISSIIQYDSIITKKSIWLRYISDFIWKLIRYLKKRMHLITNVLPGNIISTNGRYAISSYVNAKCFDVVHLQWINGGFIDIKDVKNFKKPIVWTLHDANAFTGGCHIFYDCNNYITDCSNCKYILNFKDKTKLFLLMKEEEIKHWNLHVVCTSRWMYEAVKKSRLLRDKPIYLIPNPINLKIFKPIDQNSAKLLLNLDKDTTYILFGANNAIDDKNKGFYLLLEALELLEQHLKNYKVLVFGFGTKTIKGANLNDKIHYLGELEGDISLVCAYNSATVTIVPSISENSPNIVLESFACGTPVVGFRIGGLPDMIDHLENGFLAEPYCSSDLAKGILWIVENSDDKMSSKARDKSIKTNDEKLIGEQYIDLYNRILSQ
jgi:glycosyltransferase involved in cell wall biosynthesis